MSSKNPLQFSTVRFSIIVYVSAVLCLHTFADFKTYSVSVYQGAKPKDIVITENLNQKINTSESIKENIPWAQASFLKNTTPGKTQNQICISFNCIKLNPGLYTGLVNVVSDGSNEIISQYKIEMSVLETIPSQQLWEFDTGLPVNTSPAVLLDKLYLGSDNEKLYCLDAYSGEEIWEYKANGEINSSPAVYNGIVYFGSWDNYLYALNSETGEYIWSFNTGDEVESSPLVINDKVYIGSYSGNLYCLDAETGEIIWNAITGGSISTSPAFGRDRIFVWSSDYHLYCFDSTTGEQLWAAKTINAYSHCVTYGIFVFVGSLDGKLHCVNMTNGHQIWTSPEGIYMASTPSVFNGYIYFVSYDYRIYCLDGGSGRIIWSYETGGQILNPPVISSGHVYVGSTDHRIYCLDAYNGKKIWHYETDGRISNSPALFDGKVYFGSRDGKIRCIKANTSESFDWGSIEQQQKGYRTEDDINPTKQSWSKFKSNKRNSGSTKKTLSIPHIDHTENWGSYLIIDNVKDYESTSNLVLFENGEAVYTEEVTVNPHESIAIQLLTGDCGKLQFEDYSGDNAFVKVAFVNKAQKGIAEFSLIPNESTDINFDLPNYNIDNLDWIGMAIMNPSDETADITLNAFDKNGNQLETTSLQIGQNSNFVGEMANFFPELNIEQIAKVNASSLKGLTGINISGQQLEKLLFTNSTRDTVKSGTLIMPHIAEEVNTWDNLLIFDNMDSSSKIAAINLYYDGTIVAEEAVVVSGGSTKTVNLNSFTESLIDYGELILDTDKVAVRQSFISKSQGGTAEFMLTEASATSEPSDTVIFNFPTSYIEEGDLQWHGIAIANTSDTTDTIQLQAFKNGAVVETAQIDIKGHNKKAKLLVSLFPESSANGIERVIARSSSESIALSGINISGSELKRLLFSPAFRTQFPLE